MWNGHHTKIWEWMLIFCFYIFLIGGINLNNYGIADITFEKNIRLSVVKYLWRPYLHSSNIKCIMTMYQELLSFFLCKSCRRLRLLSVGLILSLLLKWLEINGLILKAIWMGFPSFLQGTGWWAVISCSWKGVTLLCCRLTAKLGLIRWWMDQMGTILACPGLIG